MIMFLATIRVHRFSSQDMEQRPHGIREASFKHSKKAMLSSSIVVQVLLVSSKRKAGFERLYELITQLERAASG